MNKKEISELKKQFTPERNVIHRVCGCYVDGEKNIILKSKEAFPSLPEEDAFKYFDIFRKTLSGTLGKNLLNMAFPLEQESEGGTQEFLMRLRKSELKDDALLEQFYQNIIDSYDYGLNYYIILIYGVYDVPGKSTDGAEMFDASDAVYDYLLCCICPVNLSKAALGYNPVSNHMEDRNRDWVVDAPAKGFLFPAFNDRQTDIHNVLYYTKNVDDLQEDLIANVLGASSLPLAAGSQKETFNTLLEESLGDDCSYETVKNIHETIHEMIEQNKENPEPLLLGKQDVKHILEKNDVEDEKIETFEKKFDERFDDTPGNHTTMLASNITNTRSFDIKTPDVVIKVNPQRADLIETQVIDGRKCIVITINDELEINGIRVK